MHRHTLPLQKIKIAYMKSIKFTNFRCFKEIPEIDFNNITILIGENSSGKSSLTNAILLCIDNIRLMNLEDRVHGESSKVIFPRTKPIFRFDSNEFHDLKIKSFKRAYNDNSKSSALENGNPNMTFEFTVQDFKFKIVLSSESIEDKPYAEINSIIIEDLVQCVRYSHDYENQTMEYEVYEDNSKDKREKAKKLLEEYKKCKRQLNKIAKCEYHKDACQIMNLYESLRQQIKELLELDDISELPDKIIYSRLGAISSISRNLTHVVTPLGIYLEYQSEPIVLNIINSLRFYAGTIPNKPKTPENTLSHNEEWENYQVEKENIEMLKPEISCMNDSYRRIAILLSSFDIEKIAAHEVHQNILYNTSDRNDKIAEAISKFHRFNILEEEEEYEFVKDWMEEFKIGVNFYIEDIDGEAFKVNIKEKNGHVRPLADKGIGNIQLMILLLRMASYIRQYQYGNPIFIIEEPEMNLHPNLQSKLAELFYYLNQEYNFRFIIETHSEYLVRKTQVIVAEKSKKSESPINNIKCPFTVYYIPNNGKEPYSMEYQKNGKFINLFGEGFYDETRTLSMKLLDLEDEL